MTKEERGVWEQLSVFESNDYVFKWYKVRHGHSLNAARTREIGSCFTQGREYFGSARVAATSVRPLLLYYGVLALSRGVILLNNPRKSEASLKPSHGVEVDDWQGTLSDGISKVLDLRIRATNGTFSELAHASRNRQDTGWWLPGAGIGYYHVELAAPEFVRDGSSLSLDDLASRDHRLMSLYGRTTDRPSRIHLAEITSRGAGLDVHIFLSGDLDAASVSNLFGWPTGTIVEHRTIASRLPMRNYFIQLPGADPNALKALLPASQYIGGDCMFVLQDFANGDRLSEMLRTFLMSYILGMLVRYFPSRWIALLRNEKGDVAQPILMAAVNAVEADYPTLVLGALA